ncbi:MAG TPA: bacillithiol biosynthesis cysteine-adding enzyme BshC [Candidatus Xenobia bacterium]|nr:bacillithiol biosynthesis cysteine-adding enzyme BshC [Candidatus Xenobia bacterium]
MESGCIPFTQVPQTSALYRDFLYDFAQVARFYLHNPFEAASFAAAAKQIAPEASRWSAVAAVLAEQNRGWGAGADVQENIARLRDGRTLAVVTGQQVGLFGGPCYSVYKALTAIHLAQLLTAAGTPAVPVFWLASEDHDFAEVNHCLLLDARDQQLAMKDEASHADGLPVGRVKLGASIEALRQQVMGLWPRESAAEAEELLSGYAPGASYADAFARLFARLFAGHGLIILNPAHAELHRLSAPLFRRVVEEAAPLQAAIVERDRELERAGYHAQVHPRENATLLFASVNGRRVPLRRRGSNFQLTGQGELEPRALLAQLEAEPENFSANVLLRPVMQDWLLPTVAYVAGPHEAAYFAQASVLYERLLGRMPVIVPRTSLTLVPPRVQRLLAKYKLTVADCWHAPRHLATRLAERRLPRAAVRRLERAQARLEKLLAETGEAAAALDPTLRGAVETSRRKMAYQLEKIRRKAARARAEREAIIGRHTEVLAHWLYPERDLQERRVSFLSFVARHGRVLVERLLGKVKHPCRDHQVVFL